MNVMLAGDGDTEDPCRKPDPGEWKYCCPPFWYVIGDGRLHLVNHVVDPIHATGPLFLLVLSIGMYEYFYSATLPPMRWFMRTTYCLGVPTLIWVALTGPGYLPFNHPLTATAPPPTTDELRRGCAVTQRQREYAMTQPRPKRSYFSSMMGYFILRADHNCDILGTWIGYRNHRQFLLGTFFCGLYISGFTIISCYKLCFNAKTHWQRAETLIVLALCAYFAYRLMGQTLIQAAHVSRNQLVAEDWRGSKETYDRGCCRNWEELCGDRALFPFWCIPCVPLTPKCDPWGY